MVARNGMLQCMDLSIVIPAYNEAERLPDTIAAWRSFLDTFAGQGEVIVSDDGSTDDTASIVEAIHAIDPRVRVLRAPKNQGKGGAVKAGMLASKGAYRFYVDADLNIATDNVPPALALLRGNTDLVVGKRNLSEYAGEEKSVARVAAGAAVQVTRRLTVLPTIVDTQCGFKGFRADLAEKVFAATLVRGFAFDIEAIFLAKRFGARIVELPVSVTFRAGSSYNLRMHLPRFLGDILMVRANAWRGRYVR
jgi:dolichyl-phosphate beta-glucosyltransferase